MRERGFSSLCALAISGLQWWPAFVPLDATGFGDWQMIHHNWEAAYIALSRFHEWPLWDPFHCGGVTILGNPESQLYTPLFALSFVLGTVLAVKVFLWLHIAAALLGGYWLARAEYACAPIAAALAGLGFGLSGCFAWDGAGGHATFLPFAFAPWLVLCFRRSERDPRHALLTAGLLTLTLLEGGTYPFPYFVLLLGFEFARRLLLAPRRIDAFANATKIGLLVLLLGAIRLLPVAISLHDTPRAVGSRDFLTLSDLLLMLTARKHEWAFAPHPYVWPEYGSYVGWPILAFAAVGAARCVRGGARDLPCGLLVFGLLMFGSVTAYFPWPLLHHLPVFDSLRVPSRFAVLFTLYLGLLAAVGLDSVLRRWSSARWLSAAAALLLCAQLVDMLIVNHKVVNRWNGPALSAAAPAGQFKLVREADYFYASYPRRNVGTDGCYNGGMNWSVSPALWSGAVPQARVMRGRGRVTAAGITSDSVWADVTLETNARVVFNQNFAHGWIADGDGNEVIADRGRIALDLPAGQHHVQARYAPSWFAPSVLLSLLGVGLSLIWVLVLIPRRSRALAQPSAAANALRATRRGKHRRGATE
jgi:hypothetical protein